MKRQLLKAMGVRCELKVRIYKLKLLRVANILS
jgi:hypothetical protein